MERVALDYEWKSRIYCLQEVFDKWAAESSKEGKMETICRTIVKNNYIFTFLRRGERPLGSLLTLSAIW